MALQNWQVWKEKPTQYFWSILTADDTNSKSFWQHCKQYFNNTVENCCDTIILVDKDRGLPKQKICWLCQWLFRIKVGNIKLVWLTKHRHCRKEKIETFQKIIAKHNSHPSTKGTKSCYYWSKAFSSMIKWFITLVNEVGDKKIPKYGELQTQNLWRAMYQLKF